MGRVLVANGYTAEQTQSGICRSKVDEERARVEAMRPQACAHPRQEPRYQTLRNGARKPVMQCLVCGKNVRDVRRGESELRAEAQLTEDFDRALHEAGHERWREAWQHYNAERQRVFEMGRQVVRSEYYDYLETETWARRRKFVLERDEYRCQAQLDGCLGRATQVHHLTYDHRGNEPLFDLVAICRPCHERITRMDQEKRNA